MFQGKSGINEYADFCMDTDWAVGEVMQAVEEMGFSKNTLFIFTADNGCSPRAHYDKLQAAGHYPSYIYRGLKGSLWEGGHRALAQCFDKPDRPHSTAVGQPLCGGWDLVESVNDLG